MMKNEDNSTLKRLILNKIFNSYSTVQSPVHSIYNLTTPQNCFILFCCKTFIPSPDLVIEELRIKHWLRQQLTFPHPKLLSLSSRLLVVSPVWLLELLELPFWLWCFLNSFFSFALSPWLLRFLSDELMDNDSPLMILDFVTSSLASHSCSNPPQIPSLGWLTSHPLLLVALPMKSLFIPDRLETTWPIRRDNQTSSWLSSLPIGTQHTMITQSSSCSFLMCWTLHHSTTILPEWHSLTALHDELITFQSHSSTDSSTFIMTLFCTLSSTASPRSNESISLVFD